MNKCTQDKIYSLSVCLSVCLSVHLSVCLPIYALHTAWYIGTLGNTLNGCVTQDPRVAPSEACAIHLTHSLFVWLCV